MTALAPMTAAQLSNRPAARDSKVGPAGTTPVRRPAPIRPLPACPAPVPPMAPLAHPRMLAPAAGVQVACPSVLRLGRVARLVAAATVTLAVVGGLGWVGMAPSPGIPAETVVARVGAGETIWDVARRVAPEYDQRAVVERIRQLNGMAGSALQPGQQLQVPRGR